MLFDVGNQLATRFTYLGEKVKTEGDWMSIHYVRARPFEPIKEAQYGCW
jgi:hypothetical protein